MKTVHTHDTWIYIRHRFLTLAAAFLILASCFFSQRCPATSISLAFFLLILTSAFPRFRAAASWSFKTAISSLAATLTSFNSSLAVFLATINASFVAIKSRFSLAVRACLLVAAALRFVAVVFFLTEVFSLQRSSLLLQFSFWHLSFFYWSFFYWSFFCFSHFYSPSSSFYIQL